MNKLKKYCFCVLLAWMICPLSAQIIKSGDTVAFFGDTVVGLAAYGPGFIRLYSNGMNQNGIKIKTVSSGQAWITAKTIQASYDKRVKKRKATVIFINFGQSDVIRKTPFEEYKKAMRNIVKVAKADNMRVILWTLFPLYEKDSKIIAAYNKFLFQLGKEENVPVWDTCTAFLNKIKEMRTAYPAWKGFFLTDGGHLFNQMGQTVIADFLLKQSGLTEEQIKKSRDARKAMRMSFRIDLEQKQVLQILEKANKSGMSDSELISQTVNSIK